MYRFLLVDDEINVSKALRRLLLNNAITPHLPEFTVTIHDSPEQALCWAADHKVDVVISDYRMPVMDGVTFLTRMKEVQPDTALLLLSANADMEGVTRAINEVGIFRFLSKPWNDNQLKGAVADALRSQALLLENRRLADEVRLQRGVISKHELELKRLEETSPGITRVRWSDDGGVLLEP